MQPAYILYELIAYSSALAASKLPGPAPTRPSIWRVFEAGNYATTFYVGDKGVLLFDPLQGHGAQILQAIASVTKLPVTAIVYSHAHADHIADTKISSSTTSF